MNFINKSINFKQIALFILLGLTVVGIEIFFGAITVLSNSTLPIFLLAGVLVFLVFLVKPLWGYLIALFFLSFVGDTFSFDLVGGVTMRPRDIIFPIVILGWLLFYTFKEDENRLPVEKTEINNVLFVLGWYIFLTILWASSKDSSVSKSIQYVFDLCLFFLTISIVTKREDLHKVCQAWCVGGIFISFVCLFQLFFTGQRSAGFTESSLGLGEFLGYPLIFAIYLFLVTQNRKIRFGYFVVISTIFSGMLSTQARGPLLGLGAGVAFILLVLSKDNKTMQTIMKYTLFVVVIGVLGLLGLEAIGVNVGSELLTKLFQRFTDILVEEVTTEAGSVEWRLNLWRAAWGMTFDNPMLGVGIGNFGPLSQAYGLSDPSDCAHNIYFHLLAELGIIGFSIVCYFIYKLFSTCRNIHAHLILASDKLFMICLMGSLIAKGVRDLTFGFFVEDRALFLLIALAFVQARISFAEKQTSWPENYPPGFAGSGAIPQIKTSRPKTP